MLALPAAQANRTGEPGWGTPAPVSEPQWSLACVCEPVDSRDIIPHFSSGLLTSVPGKFSRGDVVLPLHSRKDTWSPKASRSTCQQGRGASGPCHPGGGSSVVTQLPE